MDLSVLLGILMVVCDSKKSFRELLSLCKMDYLRRQNLMLTRLEKTRLIIFLGNWVFIDDAN